MINEGLSYERKRDPKKTSCANNQNRWMPYHAVLPVSLNSKKKRKHMHHRQLPHSSKPYVRSAAYETTSLEKSLQLQAPWRCNDKNLPTWNHVSYETNLYHFAHHGDHAPYLKEEPHPLDMTFPATPRGCLSGFSPGNQPSFWFGVPGFAALDTSKFLHPIREALQVFVTLGWGTREESHGTA